MSRLPNEDEIRELRCVACGRNGDDVALYTPDLDIAAVALCRVDWAVLFFGLDPAMSPTAAGRRYWERLDVAAGGDDG